MNGFRAYPYSGVSTLMKKISPLSLSPACISGRSALTLQMAAQEPSTPAKPRPEDTEVWEPVPTVVTPGATCGAAPSDAIVLFDGKNLDEWVSTQDQSPANWVVHDGVVTVKKGEGRRQH